MKAQMKCNKFYKLNSEKIALLSYKGNFIALDQ